MMGWWWDVCMCERVVGRWGWAQAQGVIWAKKGGRGWQQRRCGEQQQLSGVCQRCQSEVQLQQQTCSVRWGQCGRQVADRRRGRTRPVTLACLVPRTSHRFRVLYSL